MADTTETAATPHPCGAARRTDPAGIPPSSLRQTPRPGGPGVAAVLLVPGGALAQDLGLDDEAAQREAAADLWSGLFLMAALAFAVHRVLKGKGAQTLRDMAKSLAFLASAYLAGFFFLGSVSAIARTLFFLGLERDLSMLVAVPLGVVVAYRLYTAYEKWRVHE